MVLIHYVRLAIRFINYNRQVKVKQVVAGLSLNFFSFFFFSTLKLLPRTNMMDHGGKELAAELGIGLAIGKIQAPVHKCTDIQGQTCWESCTNSNHIPQHE